MISGSIQLKVLININIAVNTEVSAKLMGERLENNIPASIVAHAMNSVVS